MVAKKNLARATVIFLTGIQHTLVLCVNQTNQSYQPKSKALKATQVLKVSAGINARIFSERRKWNYPTV